MNRNISTSLVAGMVAGSALMGGGPAGAQDDVNLVETVSPSIVYISIDYTGYVLAPATPDQPTEDWLGPYTVTSSCTGVVLDPSGTVATAGHCVDNMSEDTRSLIRSTMFDVLAMESSEDYSAVREIADAEQWKVEGEDMGAPIKREVFVAQADGAGQVIDSWVAAEVVAYQPIEEGDNAILRVNGVEELAPLPVGDEVPKGGEAVTSVGFPGVFASHIDNQRVQQPSFKSGTISSQQVNDNGVSFTEINADLAQGMSGGPTVDKLGNVVGLNSYGLAAIGDGNLSFITNTDSLRNYASQHGADLAEPYVVQASGIPMWVIVVGIVVAVIVVVATVLFFRRRGLKTAPETTSSPPAS